MLITSLGHAGLRVETREATVLIDPWFSPEGAFLGSWFPYPDNAQLMSSELTNPDAIVISHEHLDHVDEWFLSKVPSDIPVFVPRYSSKVLLRKVLAGGARPVVELPEWQEQEVAPRVRVFFVSEESPMNHDSAIVVRSGVETLVNLNDARLTPRQLREIRRRVNGNVSALALQGAGASWYPVCYRYAREHKRQLSFRKRQAKLSYVARVIEIVEPATTLPFAGPPVFLDDELRFANAELDGGIFPDQQQVADWLRTDRGISDTAVLLPGDTWDSADALVSRDGQWSGFSFGDRDGYIESYADRRRPFLQRVHERYLEPDRDLFPDFSRYFEQVLSMSPYFNEKIDMRIGFEIVGPGGGDWSVDFREGSRGVRRTDQNCQYTYRFASRWLPPILSGEVPWEDFFLSLRFEAWRQPDVYNDHLLGLLKFAWPEALDAVELYETAVDDSEWIEVTADGVTYRIQRYCPHAHQDLSEAGEILPGGTLRCLGHHYEFDLATGECLNGACDPLRSYVASAPIG